LDKQEEKDLKTSHINGVNWLNTREAATYLRVSENAIRIMAHRELLIAYKFNNRLRFNKEDLRRMIKIKGDNNGNKSIYKRR